MKFVVDVLGGIVVGFGIQEKCLVFSSEIGVVVLVICYELVFGEYFAGYVWDGKVQIVFIMINDGWWDNIVGYCQYFYYVSLWVIEICCSIVCLVNMGIFCFLNQCGDILQFIKYNEVIVIKGEVVLNDEVIFYVCWGDIIVWIVVFLSILVLFNVFVKVCIKKGEEV